MKCVEAMRAEDVRVPDRSVAPPVVGLSCEFEDAARHRDGDRRFGELRYERVCHFGEPPSFRFACDRYAAALTATSDRGNALAEFSGKRTRHDDVLPASASRHWRSVVTDPFLTP